MLKIYKSKLQTKILKRNGLCYICFEKGHISNNCTMNYSSNKYHGEHSISLWLQKSENSETKVDENNDKTNDVNVTQGRSHWGCQGNHGPPFQFLNQNRSNSFSSVCYNVWTIYSDFSFFLTTPGNRSLLVGFLKMSDTKRWTFWKVSHCGPCKRWPQ